MNFVLATFYPKSIDATSWYRGVGPIEALRRKMGFQTHSITEYSWASLAHVDAVFLQRPFMEHMFQIAVMAKKNNVPVWVDYDDLLTDIPMGNPAYLDYASAEAKKWITYTLNVASKVTVTTEALKSEYSKYASADKIIVIPNAFDVDFFKVRNRESVPTNPVIAWRGTSTHVSDLLDVFGDWEEIGEMCQRQNWKFAFYGYWLQPVVDELQKHLPLSGVTYDPLQDVVDYHLALANKAPRIMVVPLRDDVFNRSKSSCAWLEAMYAGAITVAPDWDEWRKPGIVNYSPGMFKDAVRDVMTWTKTSLMNENLRAWKALVESHDLSVVNERRAAIIREFAR